MLRDSASFTVQGADHAALKAAAREHLAAFAAPGERWEFTMHARPLAVEYDGTTSIWEAEVDAQVQSEGAR